MLSKLWALPAPKASDVAWVSEWLDAAKRTYKQIMYFGTETGPDLDQAAVLRNLVEYEDQYAAAMTFMIRLNAREATTLSLFVDKLAPEQRTPVRDAGFQRARHGGGAIIAGATGAIAEDLKPANARLITTAMRDTRDV
jgi:hypothetical protein